MKCFILTQKCIHGKMIKFAVVNTMWNFNWKYEYFINVKKVLPRLPWWSSDGTLLSNARGAGSIYGRGSRIPHALWPVDQNKERKQCFNKLNRDFENGPHFKKILKKKYCVVLKFYMRSLYLVVGACKTFPYLVMWVSSAFVSSSLLASLYNWMWLNIHDLKCIYDIMT